MTQIPFDQLSKQFLEEVLAPLGQVQRSFEVPGESKFVDIWFIPTTTPAAPSSDLLSRIAATACLLEPYRNPPTRSEVRSCLLKLLWLQEDLRRKLPPEQRPLPETDLPTLWILATSASKPLLADFGAVVRPDWQTGIYWLPAAQRTAIVSIDELPLMPETLRLRILGRGATQQQAIAEVRSLDRTDPQRSQILRILANWKVSLERNDEFAADDREVIMALSQAYLEWEQATEQRGVEQGIEQGIEQGARAGKASLILTLLMVRLGAIATPQSTAIQALSSPQLDALAIALLNFTSLSDLEQWLAQTALESFE